LGPDACPTGTPSIAAGTGADAPAPLAYSRAGTLGDTDTEAITNATKYTNAGEALETRFDDAAGRRDSEREARSSP
jgi:hypothetical protein